MYKGSFSTRGLLSVALSLYSLSIFASFSSSLRFEILYGNRVRGEMNYLKGVAVSMSQCAFRCSRDDNCRAASYNDNGSCDMSVHKVTRFGNKSGLTEAPLWMVLTKKECEAGWIKFMDHCYYMSNESQLYVDARASCVQKGSHLVQVDSVEEANFLFKQMEETRNYVNESKYRFWNDLYELSPGVHVWRTSNDSYDPKVIEWAKQDTKDYQGNQSCTQFVSQWGFQMGDSECEDDIRDDPNKTFRDARAICEH